MAGAVDDSTINIVVVIIIIIIILGITWRDKVTNKEVRKRTGQIHLEKVIRERRMRWLGHVARMDEVYACRNKCCTGKLRDSGEDLAGQG